MTKQEELIEYVHNTLRHKKPTAFYQPPIKDNASIKSITYKGFTITITTRINDTPEQPELSIITIRPSIGGNATRICFDASKQKELAKTFLEVYSAHEKLIEQRAAEDAETKRERNAAWMLYRIIEIEDVR